MANLGGTYDATGGQKMDDRSVLPEAEYVSQICKSEVKNAKRAPNRYVNLEFEVLEGDRKGARFWSMLNLWNDNEQAVEIAQRELNSICHACGKLRVSDTEELHGIPIRVKLKVSPARDGYEAQNRVAAYKPLNEAPGGSQSTLPPPSTSGAQERRGPWASSAA